ncbi:hypothetical protein Tco_1099943 [Tanacetum coccineum]
MLKNNSGITSRFNMYKPCPDEPPENAAENVKAAWKAEYKIHSDVACLMLGKMSPALQRQFELYFPQAMLNELKKMFEKPQAVEIYDLVPTIRVYVQMETSATREYPSLIHTFFLTHTVGGVFLNPEDKALYDEMLRLQGLGSNTPTGVPYTEDEIMAIVREGKQRGHIPGVGRVLPGQGTVIPPPSQSTHSADIARLKKREKRLTKQVNMFMRLFSKGIPFELFRSTYPGRHVARETYPQRQVAWDTPDLSLGNMANVVVMVGNLISWSPVGQEAV